MASRIQRKVMSSRSLRCSAGVVGDFGWLCMRLRAGLAVLGFEWVEAVQRQSESGDSFEQPLEMRLVDDRPADLRLAVMGADRHAVERGRIAWSEFSFDHDPVAMRRHANYDDARRSRF